MTNTHIVKWGNSLAVRIPKILAEEAGLGEGDPVLMGVSAGRLEVRRAKPVPTLRELVSQISPAKRYPEVRTGRPRGREVVEW